MKCQTSALAVALTVGLGALCACPERAEIIDQVGGSPARQIEDVHVRLDKAATKVQETHDTAEASGNNP